MPAPRRTLVILLAALALGPTPACLCISSGPATHDESAEAKAPSSGEFAIYPKRPGEVIRKNPDAVSTAAKPPAFTEPMVPTPPVSDHNIVKAADPGPLPSVTIPSVAEPSLLAAMRAYLDNRSDDAIRLLQPLDRSSQDLALALMPILVRGTQMKLVSGNPEELAVMVEQLHGVVGRLETKAALRVENMTFYRDKVDGFGRYDPWPEAKPFRPSDLAKLYFEVRNVGSEPVVGPHGETFLSRTTVSIEIRDANNNIVEQPDLLNFQRKVRVNRMEYADYSRSQVHDYFRTYRIQVPNQPGVYTAVVEIRDPVTGRVTRSQPVRFDVAGP